MSDNPIFDRALRDHRERNGGPDRPAAVSVDATGAGTATDKQPERTIGSGTYSVDEPASDDLPEITIHRGEHGRFLRCGGCGAEVVTGAEGILHDEGCARRRSWR